MTGYKLLHQRQRLGIGPGTGMPLSIHRHRLTLPVADEQHDRRIRLPGNDDDRPLRLSLATAHSQRCLYETGGCLSQLLLKRKLCSQ